jgi:hypothetical protein
MGIEGIVEFMNGRIREKVKGGEFENLKMCWCADGLGLEKSLFLRGNLK